MDSRDAGQVQGRHDLACDIRLKGACYYSILFYLLKEWAGSQLKSTSNTVLSVLSVSPELEFPVQEFAHSESYIPLPWPCGLQVLVSAKEFLHLQIDVPTGTLRVFFILFDLP